MEPRWNQDPVDRASFPAQGIENIRRRHAGALIAH
jgi:hypothetical protein